MDFFIDVIVPLAVPDTFTYRITADEFKQLQPGCRVAVPFGKTAIYTALVIRKHQEKPLVYEPKAVHEILDTVPVVVAFQLQHWQWMAHYYMCTPGEVYKAALPSNLLLESETIVTYLPENSVAADDLTDDEFLLCEAFQRQPVLKIEEIVKIVNYKKVLPVIQSLLTKKLVRLQEEMTDTYKPKIISYVRLPESFQSPDKLQEVLDLTGRSAKQKQVVLAYFQWKAREKQLPVTIRQLSEEAQVSEAIVKALIKKGILEYYSEEKDRVIFEEATSQLQLSEPQQKGVFQIKQTFQSFDVCLLHGITGSGKTEIYIQLIEEYLKQDRQVLYLLPEIALTTQLVHRVTAHFGNQVAVYHSRYSLNERVEVWKQLLEKSDRARVVIGARSAIFLPFTHLGLIVVDEEHEASYKQQDPAPRYHARDAAVVLAKIHGAKVILGSATPSLESYYNAYQGKYGKVTLTQRFGKSILPDIQLIDLKEGYKRKQMTGHFSQALIDAMQAVLAEHEQIILFQNRRGYSPVLECLSCGHVPQCPSCDVSLTYYKFKDHLKCHYCGFTMARPIHCHACNSTDVTTKGFGTEQIEIELKQLFPTKRIARMDQDTTRGKFAFEKLMEAFKNREIDILIGTQMLAKGLDFENVTLVGVMNADNALHFPDFRAHERAFQMLIQVSGRAGRAEKKGKVMIQTYNPYHTIIQQVLQNDYAGMFKEQMYERVQFNYPPFYRLIRLQLKHADYQKLKTGAFWLYEALKAELEMPVLGPEEPGISRIRNQYIRVILIKIPVNKSLEDTKKRLSRKLQSFESIAGYRSIKTTINVDYY